MIRLLKGFYRFFLGKLCTFAGSTLPYEWDIRMELRRVRKKYPLMRDREVLIRYATRHDVTIEEAAQGSHNEMKELYGS